MREINEGKNEVKATLDLNRSKQIAIIILIVVATIALGILTINQGLGYLYKSKFLGTPCEFCVKLNPHLEHCINPNADVELMNGSRSREIYGENFSNITFGFFLQ